MKQIFISLLLLGVTNSEKLDNTYLPPHNAQSSAGSSFVQPPTVADSRANFEGQSTQISGQYSLPNSRYSPRQYPSTSVQNLPPNRQYLPVNGVQKFPSNDQFPSPSISSIQYSPPTDFSRQSNGPSTQYSPSRGLFSSPKDQYSGSAPHLERGFSSGGALLQQSSSQNQFQQARPAHQTASRGLFSPPKENTSSKDQYSGSATHLDSGFSTGGVPLQQSSSQNQFQQARPAHQTASRGLFTPPKENSSSKDQYSGSATHLDSGFSTGGVSLQQSGSQNQFHQAKPAQQTPSRGLFTPPKQGGLSKDEYSGSGSFSQDQSHQAYQNYQPIGYGQGPAQSNRNAAPTNQYGVPKSDNTVSSFSNRDSLNQYPGNANPIAIVRSAFNPNAGDGSYQYSYETENGISAEEQGSLVNNAEAAKGGYSYTSPEGENIAVEYVADENGFQPKGAHIPQIPEAILKSIELNKASAARGENQEGQYREEYDSQASSQAGYQYQGANGAKQVFDGQFGGGSSFLNKGFGSDGGQRSGTFQDNHGGYQY